MFENLTGWVHELDFSSLGRWLLLGLLLGILAWLGATAFQTALQLLSGLFQTSLAGFRVWCSAWLRLSHHADQTALFVRLRGYLADGTPALPGAAHPVLRG